MALIKVSEIVKEELEQLKERGEFKSLDAVIRHYIDSLVEVNGGIFLGSMDENIPNLSSTGIPPYITIKNVRHSLITNSFTHSFISPPETIRLYKCLKCQTTSFQKEDEIIIVPNCLGCGKGMTPITIQVGFKDSEF